MKNRNGIMAALAALTLAGCETPGPVAPNQAAQPIAARAGGNLENRTNGATSTNAAPVTDSQRIAELLANSYDHIASVYTKVVGANPDPKDTPAVMRANMALAVLGTTNFVEQVKAYKTLAASGISGVDLPKIADEITEKYMQSLSGKGLGEVLDGLKVYSELTGARVIADSKGTKFYVDGSQLNGKKTAYTIFLSSGRAAVGQGYHGELSDIFDKEGLTILKYTELAVKHESVRSVEGSKGVKRILTLADSVEKKYIPIDDPRVKKTLDEYFATDAGKRLGLTVEVGFSDQKGNSDINLGGNLARCYQTGALPPEVVLRLLQYGKVGYTPKQPEGEVIAGNLITAGALLARPDVTGAMLSNDCGVEYRLTPTVLKK